MSETKQHILDNRLVYNNEIIKDFDDTKVKDVSHIFNGAVHSVLLCKYKDEDIIKKIPLFNGSLLVYHNELYTNLMSKYVLDDIIPNFPIKYKIYDNIIYEEYANSDLFEWLCKRKIDDKITNDIFNIFIQTIITIYFLNTKNGLIHNDIKCENILIKEYDEEFGIMYKIDNVEFFIKTKYLTMITDFDMMFEYDKHYKNGISNLSTLIPNFYRNKLFAANDLTMLHLFEYNNVIMNDILSCIVCILNIINNLETTTNNEKIIKIEIQSVFYKLLSDTLKFKCNQTEYIKYIKEFFEKRDVIFDEIINENYKKIIIKNDIE